MCGKQTLGVDGKKVGLFKEEGRERNKLKVKKTATGVVSGVNSLK